MGSPAGEIAGGGLAILGAAMNNMWADARTSKDRYYNNLYNELAANNADRRTRALYNDFYSPQALLNQYLEAGLSPSLMFGGTPGQGGTSGAQGAGVAGPQTPFYGVSALEAAQIGNLMAQTQKTKAETKNINQDTEIKEFETKLKEFETKNQGIEFAIMNSRWVNQETGEATSLFEMADDSFTYEEFLKDVRTNAEGVDPTIYNESQTEQGQKVLRAIYENSSRFHRDIMVLSEETVDAKFQMSIISALEKEGYADKNAEAAIKQLQNSIDTSTLDSTQKQAWQRVIDKLGKKGSTWQDIMVVLGMIVNNFAGKVGVQIRTGGK